MIGSDRGKFEDKKVFKHDQPAPEATASFFSRIAGLIEVYCADQGYSWGTRNRIEKKGSNRNDQPAVDTESLRRADTRERFLFFLLFEGNVAAGNRDRRGNLRE